MKFDWRAYRRDCWLGVLGALFMLAGDLCLSVIPASAGDSGLFLREAYLSGAYEPWRLPLLAAGGPMSACEATEISSIPIWSRRFRTGSMCPAPRFTFSTRLKWEKNTAHAICGISPIRSSMSRTCSTKSCWPASRHNGRSS